ncbi:MAG: hypothetical protein PHG41_05385 [Actinomycetota bacterium]|nr:hypothetical protein [Actinomycetota bacterium]
MKKHLFILSITILILLLTLTTVSCRKEALPPQETKDKSTVNELEEVDTDKEEDKNEEAKDDTIQPVEIPGTPWKLVSKDAYKLAKAGKEDLILFKILQDKDLEEIVKITNEYDRIDENSEKDLEEARKEYVRSIKDIKILKKDGSLKETKKEEFDVKFYDHVEDMTETFFMVDTDSGKKAIIPMEAEGFASNHFIGLGCEFAVSNSGEKYLIATTRGLWMLDGGSKSASKVPQETTYNGKSYEELKEEMDKTFAGAEASGTISWNGNIIFSPDDSKIAYITNRDCSLTGGQSVWMYDFNTGKEKALLVGSGDFYGCIGWISPGHILCRKYTGDRFYNYVVDITGKITEVTIEREKINILGTTSSGLIAYSPDENSDKIYIDSFDLQSGLLLPLYRKEIDGTLRKGFDGFSDDGSKFAYKFAPSENDTIRYIGVIDINEGSEAIISELPVKENRVYISGFSWIDNEKLLINISTIKDGKEEISTWIYNLKGDNK